MPTLSEYVNATHVVASALSLKHIYATSDNHSFLQSFAEQLTSIQNTYKVITLPEFLFKFNESGAAADNYPDWVNGWYSKHPNEKWDYFALMTELTLISKGRYILHGQSQLGQADSLISHHNLISKRRICYHQMLRGDIHIPYDKLRHCALLWSVNVANIGVNLPIRWQLKIVAVMNTLFSGGHSSLDYYNLSILFLNVLLITCFCVFRKRRVS